MRYAAWCTILERACDVITSKTVSNQVGILFPTDLIWEILLVSAFLLIVFNLSWNISITIIELELENFPKWHKVYVRFIRRKISFKCKAKTNLSDVLIFHGNVSSRRITLVIPESRPFIYWRPTDDHLLSTDDLCF